MDNHSNPGKVSHTVKHSKKTVPTVVGEIIKPPHPQLSEKSHQPFDILRSRYQKELFTNKL